MKVVMEAVVVVVAIIAIWVGCAKKEAKPPMNYTVAKEETLPTGDKTADIIVEPGANKEDLFKLARYLNRLYAAYTVYDSKEVYTAITNPPAPQPPVVDTTKAAKPESAQVAQPQVPTGPTPEEIAAHTLIKKADKNSPAYWVKDNLQEEIK